MNYVKGSDKIFVTNKHRSRIELVSIEKLTVSEANVRKHGIDKERLKQSIEKEGVLEPLHVGYNHKRSIFEIMQGQHRYYGALSAGIKEIECVVHLDIKTFEEAKRWCIKEACFQKDLDLFDKLQIVEDLKKQYGSLKKACEVERLPYHKLKHWASMSKLSNDAKEEISHSGKSVPLRDIERIVRYPEEQHVPILGKIKDMSSEEKQHFFSQEIPEDGLIVGVWVNNKLYKFLVNQASSHKLSVEKLCSKIIEESAKND